MQRDQQNASPTPILLRRSHARHQEHSYQPSFAFGSNGPTHFGESPDLSVHLPQRHSSNRFEVLALPSPPETDDVKEFHVPSRYRRSRNSRGTKEAKRRRDTRRSRRKMAAQMLDEQLSRDIDFALSRVNGFPTPPSSVPSPIPALSTDRATPVWSTYLPPLPPSPPQLPALDFNSFGINVNSFLEARAARATPSPPTPLVPELPSWCPPLPCLTRKGIWSEGLPIFYDLSSLPEPKEGPMAQRDPKLCQELQLWRGNLDVKPKQSRFFPVTQAPKKPRVKLASNACKLHFTEKGLPDKALDPPSTYADAVKKGIDMSSVKRGEDREITADIRSATPTLGPPAANLWNILAAVDSSRREASADPYLASFLPSSDESYQAAWEAHINLVHQPHGPAELDGREIPYVHANSLTGHSNEVLLSLYANEHPALSDSGVCFTPLASPPLGMNELMMDYGIGLPYAEAPKYAANYDSAELQQPISTQHSLVLADILPINCVHGANDDGEQALEASDAHFQSEQSLFTLGTAPEPTSADDIDIATFLKMGHARNCWCNACSDAPERELSSTSEDYMETDTPELVPFDKLTEMDDEWMLYLPTGGGEQSGSSDDQSASDGQSGCCAPQTEGKIVEEEKPAARAAPEWNDIFPCKPHVTCEAEMGVQRIEEVIGLGDSEVFDWILESEY
ncbi:hypothetical protein B0A55_06394 [Friedmanniomyces simplex]|uniref:Uncharacterized protein n=1 Tax=Friedmanniomyces simplex TaxID=329884 RepID=A0A4U0XFV1_9PEZI|nr:hypothetical protein B0A55_06394 [Friedmanniomyces simplex]